MLLTDTIYSSRSSAYLRMSLQLTNGSRIHIGPCHTILLRSRRIAGSGSHILKDNGTTIFTFFYFITTYLNYVILWTGMVTTWKLENSVATYLGT